MYCDAGLLPSTVLLLLPGILMPDGSLNSDEALPAGDAIDAVIRELSDAIESCARCACLLLTSPSIWQRLLLACLSSCTSMPASWSRCFVAASSCWACCAADWCCSWDRSA